MRNHLGQYECRLCLTLHNNEGNYLAHTQARSTSLALHEMPMQVSVRTCPNGGCSGDVWQGCEPCLVSSSRACPERLCGRVQGKRHQQNMAKRAAREAAEKPAQPQPQKRVSIKKTVKIGRPGYRVTKQFDPEVDQRSLLFQVPPAQMWSLMDTVPIWPMPCRRRSNPMVLPAFTRACTRHACGGNSHIRTSPSAQVGHPMSGASTCIM